MKKLTISSLFFLLFSLMALFLRAGNLEDVVAHLQFDYLSSSNGLPCDEVQVVHQDREGYLWIGTRLGLFQYDGYQTKTFKNNQEHRNLLTSNNITALCDDPSGCLWIGTNSGLNRFDRRTGVIHQYHLNAFDNSDVMACILYTSSGNLWVGTDGGLFCYDAKADTFMLYCNTLHNSLVPHCSIKSLIEDHKGIIWIGTWDQGLFRYDPKKALFYKMPKFNDVNSAHVVYEDSHNRLWIGTWGKGLYLLENPYGTNEALRFHNYYCNGRKGEIIDNVIYSLREDPATATLWVGTKLGLSIRSINNIDNYFINYPSLDNKGDEVLSRGVASLIHDQSGRIWMSVIGCGAASTSTRPRYFSNYSLTPAVSPLKMDVIRCVAASPDGKVWMGLDKNGLLVQDVNTHESQLWNHVPQSEGFGELSNVNSLFFSSSGELYIATTRDGFYRVAQEKKVVNYNMSNSSWIADNCFYTFYEDDSGKILLGSWAGLSLLYSDGHGRFIKKIGNTDISKARVHHIMRSREGDYWLCTRNMGLLRLSGDLEHPEAMRLVIYNELEEENYPLNYVIKTLQDSKGRIWACSQEVGLLLWNSGKNQFECVNRRFAIPGDNVSAMEEDKRGFLWLSTNYGLLRLGVSADGKKADLRIFSTLDGLQSNYFKNNLSCVLPDGRLCFGNFGSVTLFDAAQVPLDSANVRVRITDIKIFNNSLENLDENERMKVSQLLPPYATHLVLAPEQNNLTLEFSTLTFDNPQECRFAYMLKGVDNDWVYTDAGRHSASYSNLAPGTYTFYLKATNSKGIWSPDTHMLTVVVLPPLWLRWWAFILYALLLALIVYGVHRFLHRREKQRRQLQLARLENEKIEELNHKKLQFFTNITHDLMTPLTIISATVGEMQQKMPDAGSYYEVVQNNIDRLMRLLQQILEFRKAETGNLKLRVSQGDLAAFCRKEVESIQPLMRNKKIHLSLLCDPQNIPCYYDPDKVDKILYNLLSNAAKYNHEMGFVQITLTYGKDKDHICLVVKDNGMGIAPERQKNLFQRFYEGEYRKFNTYGTGIGLSLTKDLVELHQGTITVESKQGEGTTFAVTLPVDRSFFKEEEIDDTPVLMPAGVEPESDLSPQEKDDRKQPDNDDEKVTLLLVEDNEELLALMTRLLKHDYNVLTAMNGREALTILDNEEVDLIVSDIMMPEMDGIELTRTLKSSIETSHIPIILLTAKRAEEDRTQAYEVGADAYITKPFHLSVLYARIRNLLKRRERAVRDFKNKHVIELGDFELTSIDEEFLKKCVACVQEHLSDADFDQQLFADAVGTSKSTLYRKLKSLTGLNTSAFIRNIRLKVACGMIEHNARIRISDLAYAVGYNDPKYFSSCFKKEFGMLPSEYIDRFMPDDMPSQEVAP